MTTSNANKIGLLERALQRVLNRASARWQADPAAASPGEARLEGGLAGAPSSSASEMQSSPPPASAPSVPVPNASYAAEERDEFSGASAPPARLQSEPLFSAAAADVTPTDETSFAAVSEVPCAAVTPRELEDGVTEVEEPAEAQSSSRRRRVSDGPSQAPAASLPPEGGNDVAPSSGRHLAASEHPTALVPEARLGEDNERRDVSQIVPRFSADESPTLPRNGDMEEAQTAFSEPPPRSSSRPLPSSTKAMPPPLRRSVPASMGPPDPFASQHPPADDSIALSAASVAKSLTDEELTYGEEETAYSVPPSSLQRTSISPPSSASPGLAALTPAAMAPSLVPFAPRSEAVLREEEFRAAVVERTTLGAAAEPVAHFLSASSASVPTTFGELLDQALSL